MKSTSVLFLVPDLIGPPGGIARCSRIVSRALIQEGFTLTVLALHDSTQMEQSIALSFPGLQYCPCGGNRAVFVRRAFAMVRSRPSIILLGHPHFAHLGWLIAQIVRAKLSIFIYGLDVWEPLSAFRRGALRRADQILAISRLTAQRAVETNGVSPERIRILYLCLDPGFKPSVVPVATNLQLSMLTVARILSSEQYKGHEQVIRVMPSLLQQFPNLVYDIVGDGEGRAEMERLAVQEGVAGVVRFHGVLSDEDLARMYAEASLYIMPSRREGFGFVFLEAMAYGLPVVAGNQDATVEVVRHGETGLLVDPSSIKDLVDAASQLLADPNLRQEMGKRGAEVAATTFSYATFRNTLVSYLNEPRAGSSNA